MGSKAPTNIAVEGKGFHISPTRADLAGYRCARRWAMGAIFDQPEGTTDTLEFGTKLHKVAEDYYNDGKQPDLVQIDPVDKKAKRPPPGKLFAAGLKHLPPLGDPAVTVNAEVPVTLPPITVTLSDGSEFTHVVPGTADLVTLWNKASVLELIDHKTSSNPFKWAKTSMFLQNEDWQSQLYGLALMLKAGPDVKWIRAMWLYYPTKGKMETVPVRFNLVREDCEKFFAENAKPAMEWMLLTHLEPPTDPMDVPPRGIITGEEYSDCRSFFKDCPYMFLCEKGKKAHDRTKPRLNSFVAPATSATTPATSAKEKKPMSDMFAKLREQRAAKAAAEATPVVEVVEVAEEVVELPEPIVEAPAKKAKKAPVVNAPEGAAPPAKDPPPAKAKKTRKAKKVAESTPEGLLILVNAMVTQGEFPAPISLSEIAQDAMRDAADAEDVADWRLIDFKAAGVLAFHFEQWLLDNPQSGTIFVDRFSAEGKALLTVLERQPGARVIRGC